METPPFGYNTSQENLADDEKDYQTDQAKATSLTNKIVQ